MSERPRHLVDLLITGGWVLTLDEERRVLQDGGLAVVDGEIVQVAKSGELRARFHGREEIDAAGGLIHPGFVDAHVHLFQHLGRSSIPDVFTVDREHEQWLPYWHALDADAISAAAGLGIAEMARNGTTSFMDMGGDVDITASITERIGLRGVLSGTIWDQPGIDGVVAATADHQLGELADALRKRPPTERVAAGVGLVGMGRCSDELLVGAKQLADGAGARMYLHLSFTAGDTEAVSRAAGGRAPVEHLHELGVLDENVSLVHAIHLNEHEQRLLRDSGASVVHCPLASARYGLGAPTIGSFPELLAAGVPVALGSDAGNFADAFDLPRLMFAMLLLHREAHGRVPTISAEQALEMATLSGATAMGTGHSVGCLAPNYRADVVIHDRSRPEAHPMLDPVTNLVYSSQSKTVRTVLVDGKKVLADGKLMRFDEQGALEEVDRVATKLHARMAYAPRSRWPVA